MPAIIAVPKAKIRTASISYIITLRTFDESIGPITPEAMYDKQVGSQGKWENKCTRRDGQ